MSEAFASLLEEIRARGDAPAIRWADGDVRYGDLLDDRGDAPEQGLVVLDGMGTVDTYKRALLAWRAGRATFFLSPREPAHRVPDLALDGPATLLNTSGSSGAPRVAVHKLERHIQSARAGAAYFELGSGATWLLSLPTHHVGGLGIVFRCLVAGAVLAMPRPDEALGAALTRCRPTHVSLVATQLKRLLEDERHAQALAACRAVLVGGSAIPEALRRRALDMGVPLHVSYGSTETTAFVAASGDPEIVARPGSAGLPLPNRHVEIAADGEIRVGGEALFDGYLQDGRVVSPVDEDGFYASGDVGRIEDGVLYVDGRKDRMLVSGGENVHPEEIENALAAIDGVTRAVVVGVDDAEFGMRPVAFVEGDVTSPDLEGALREHLPGFKVPDAFYAMPGDALSGLKPDIAGLTARLRDPEAFESLRAL